MQIRHRDIESLIPVLDRLGQSTAPFLVYFVARNIQIMRPVSEAIRLARAPIPGVDVYMQEHKTLCLKHAERDAQARPISTHVKTMQGEEVTYAIADKGAFDEELNQLNAKHAEIRDKVMEQQTQLRRLLQEQVDVELVTMRMSDCPEGVIDGNTAGFLMALNLLKWDTAVPLKSVPKET